MNRLTKLQAARLQLGTALELFILNRDPISVQCLACGAGEILEGIARSSSITTLSNLLLNRNPDLDVGEVKRIKNKYWNSFKHFYDKDNKTPRNDEEILGGFSDFQNDAALMVAWTDYANIAGKLPIAAQVFQVWWLALNQDKISPSFDTDNLNKIFPNIANDNRDEQKRRLRRSVEKYEKEQWLLVDIKTEPKLRQNYK